MLENSHPFLAGEEFIPGWVQIKGIRFNDLMLNFDIYTQALLLKYRDAEEALRVIEISPVWLDAFGIGDKIFQVTADDAAIRVMQVLGQTPVTILYSWSKTAQLTRLHGKTGFLFSEPARINICRIDSFDYSYRKNRDFVRLFQHEVQVEIRNYLKNNNINIRKASDQQVISLLKHFQFLTDN